MLFAKNNGVVALDVVDEMVAMLKRREAPIEDAEIEGYLKNKPLNFRATLDRRDVYAVAEYVIIATPTDYDPEINYFNTRSIESVIRDVMEINSKAVMVIKSTVKGGYTAKKRLQFPGAKLIFSPEFLRESKALHGNCIPPESWLVSALRELKSSQAFFRCGAIKVDVPTLFTESIEAEAIKVFANT